MPSSDCQFTVRRANPKGVSPLVARERYADRRPSARQVDAYFMQCLWEQFGEEPFQRGNLDAGRLSWLFGREVVPAGPDFDPKSYESLLKINKSRAMASFPNAFAGN